MPTKKEKRCCTQYNHLKLKPHHCQGLFFVFTFSLPQNGQCGKYNHKPLEN